MSDAPLFLGLDSSTQSLKAILIDDQLAVQGEWSVNFDADLPQYKTRGGVHVAANGLGVTSPPVMWVEALDRLLERMRQDHCPFAHIAAVSGSGQQHGSVYWRRGARARLQSLNFQASLADQLRLAFAVAGSPIWMDSSTSAECREREEAMGGPQALADLTGSRAYERFTGNQIARIYRLNPDGYTDTERISLVSSFMASLLIGDYAPIDVSDGSGMNLMNLRTRQWDPRSLEITAPDLAGRLGTLALAHETAGYVSAYHQQRYGFSPETPVIVFSGDNPNSLAGLRLKEAGDVAISLGTSDTMFGALREPRPSASEGHIFASPVDPDGYMAMIVYKNGSLTREAIRDAVANGSWSRFEALLANGTPGNGGNIGFYYKEPEITPPVLKTGMHRFGPDGRPLAAFAPSTEVRAVVEGQFLSMRLHSGNVGLKPIQILATGGASANHSILQIMSNVFGVPIFTADKPNSAALGAAYRALHGWTCAAQARFVPFAEVMKTAPPFSRAATPDMKANAFYTTMLPTYARLEQIVM